MQPQLREKRWNSLRGWDFLLKYRGKWRNFILFSSTGVFRDRTKIRNIVDDLLDSLGLASVQNTMIGSPMLRGLSGGEKKRVAIGVEIITNPSLLFLDERNDLWNIIIISLIDVVQQLLGWIVTVHGKSSKSWKLWDRQLVVRFFVQFISQALKSSTLSRTLWCFAGAV